MTLPDVEEQHDGHDVVVTLLQEQPEDHADGWKNESDFPAGAADDPGDEGAEEGAYEAVDDGNKDEPGEQDDVEEIDVDEIDKASNVSWHPDEQQLGDDEPGDDEQEPAAAGAKDTNDTKDTKDKKTSDGMNKRKAPWTPTPPWAWKRNKGAKGSGKGSGKGTGKTMGKGNGKNYNRWNKGWNNGWSNGGPGHWQQWGTGSEDAGLVRDHKGGGWYLPNQQGYIDADGILHAFL